MNVSRSLALATRERTPGIEPGGTRRASRCATVTPSASSSLAVMLIGKNVLETSSGRCFCAGFMVNRIFSFLFILAVFLLAPGLSAEEFLREADGGDVIGSVYDRDGNLVSDGAVRAYEYDSENRLVKVVVGGVELSYEYDSQGRCVRRQEKADGVLESTSVYVYEGKRVVEEKNYDGVGVLQGQRSYVWSFERGDVGGLLAVKEQVGAQAGTYYYIYDGNGNVVGVLDGSGAQVAWYGYDAFGKVIESSGEYAMRNAWRAGTKNQDRVSGLYNYGHRWYDSGKGRWLTRDPLEERGGLNVYGYCNNAALNYVEYYGGSFLDYIPRAGDIRQAYDELPDILRAPLVVASFPVKAGSSLGEGAGRIIGDIGGIGLAGWDNGADAAAAAAGVVGEGALRDLVERPLDGLGRGKDVLKRLWEDPCERKRLMDLLNKLPGKMGDRWMDDPLSIADDIAMLSALAAEGMLFNAAWNHLNKGIQTVENIPAKLYHYTGEGNVGSILEKGLTPGRTGQVFTTTNGSLTPIQAQIELALSPNRGLPGALLEIDAAALQRAGIKPTFGPARVLPTGNAPGGGVEIIFGEQIPAEFIKRVR